ncbi:MAG: hypothetical protein J6I52_11195 [Prevotella sp.]|nr:hypothetical protein [Prevotella sp.]
MLVLMSLLVGMAVLPAITSLADEVQTTRRLLMLKVLPEEAGTPYGGGAYEPGTSVWVSAGHDGDFVFEYWSNDDGDTVSVNKDFSYTVKDQDETLTAHFTYNPGSPGDPAVTAPRYPIVVMTQPADIGWAGVNGQQGGGLFPVGTQVSLDTWDYGDYRFEGWYSAAGDKLSDERWMAYTVQARPDTLFARYAYEPGSPGDPTVLPIRRYHLELTTWPEPGITDCYGGGANTLFGAGESAWVGVNGVADYRFLGWYDTNGDLVSEEMWFTHVMPADNDTLCAHFSYEPGSPADPQTIEDDNYALYVMDKKAVVGRTVEVPFYMTALNSFRDVFVSMTFPKRLTPDVSGIRLAADTEGYTLRVMPEQNDSTLTVQLTGGSMPAVNTTLFTLLIEVPEDMETGRDYPIEINRARVADSNGAIVTPVQRNGVLSVYKTGDLDGDDDITIDDKHALIDWLLHDENDLADGNSEDLQFEQIWDVNNDGRVDVTDALSILEIIRDRESSASRPYRAAAPAEPVATENVIQVVPCSVQPGMATADAVTSQFAMLNSSSQVWAFQFDVRLPEGVAFDEDASLNAPFTLPTDGRYALATNGLPYHNVACNHLSDGRWRIIVSPDLDSRIADTEGTVLDARLVTLPTAADGVLPVSVSRAVIGIDGNNSVRPVPSSSFVTMGSGPSVTATEPMDLTMLTGYLPSFVVDNLNQGLLSHPKLTSVDLSGADSIGVQPQLANPNGLLVVNASLSLAQESNVVRVSDDGAVPACPQLVLTEDGGPFEAPFAFEAVSIEMTRPLSAGNWNTICLPFAMSGSEVAEKFGISAQLARFEGMTEDVNGQQVLRFRQINLLDEGIEPNVPYLFRPAVAVSQFGLSHATVQAGAGTQLQQTYDSFTFIGSYEPGIIVPEGCYYISGNQFWRSRGLSTMQAFRGYFRDDSPVPSGARSLSFQMLSDDEGDTPTQVVFTRADDGVGQGAVYNLQGTRVSAPRHGVYVTEGRKILVK